MTVSIWHYTANPEKRVYDLIVIGAGVAGLSVAYWYRQKFPASSILVVDKDSVGFGASGRNAGFVTCGSVGHFQNLMDSWGLQKALERWKFSEKNHSLMRQHLGLESGDFDYSQGGSLSLATSPKNWDSLRATAVTMRANGLPVEEISAGDLETNHSLAQFKGGVFYRYDGQINPAKLLNALTTNARAEIRGQTEVFEILPGESVQIETSKGKFRGQQVIIATNAYANLLPHPTIPKILPQRSQVLLTEPIDSSLIPSCYSREDLCYFRQLPNQCLLIGGFRHLDKLTENTYEDRLNLKIQSALESFICEHLNISDPITIRHRWSGLMGFTEDERPKLLNIDQNLFFIGGFSGHGMGIAFHLGQYAVGLMNGKALPEFLL